LTSRETTRVQPAARSLYHFVAATDNSGVLAESSLGDWEDGIFKRAIRPDLSYKQARRPSVMTQRARDTVSRMLPCELAGG